MSLKGKDDHSNSAYVIVYASSHLLLSEKFLCSGVSGNDTWQVAEIRGFLYVQCKVDRPAFKSLLGHRFVF